MNKTHKVVMLPTKKSNNVGDIVMRPSDKRLAIINILTRNDPQECVNQHLYILSDEQPREGDLFYNSLSGIGRCIYRNDSEKDFTVNYNDGKGEVSEDINYCSKIVATTDKSLLFTREEDRDFRGSEYERKIALPQIPESFVKVFVNDHNDGKPITEVDLEMESHLDDMPDEDDMDLPWRAYVGYRIKTRPDNTVIVHQSKMYSKIEVIKMLQDCAINFGVLNVPKDDGTITQKIDEWIKNNL